jgi:hypothetical protein
LAFELSVSNSIILYLLFVANLKLKLISFNHLFLSENSIENRNVNIPFSSDLLEGDMLVGQQVKKIALAGGDISKATTGRKRGATKHAIWPNGVIPYTFDQFTSDGKFAYIQFSQNGTSFTTHGNIVEKQPFYESCLIHFSSKE